MQPVRAGMTMDVAIPLWHQAAEERFAALPSSEKRPKVRGYVMTLYGFMLGFMMALALLLFYDPFLLQSEQWRARGRSNEYFTFERLAARQQVADATRALQQQLTDEVRVLCLVMTCPNHHESRAAAVLATWGKRCSKLIFWSSEWDEELGAVPVVEPEADTYDNLWNKTREGFRYAYEQYFEDYDWFLKADDDTYVIMENLRYMLYPYSPDVSILFGYMFKTPNGLHMSGGAGYVLSKEALRRFMVDGYNNSENCLPGTVNFPEDYTMSKCLENLGAIIADSRAALPTDNKSKFFPLPAELYMNNDTLLRTTWLTEMTPFKLDKGLECCSNYTITYHYVRPKLMYMYELMIYRLQVIGWKQLSPIAELPKKLSLTEIERRFSYSFLDTKEPSVNSSETV